METPEDDAAGPGKLRPDPGTETFSACCNVTSTGTGKDCCSPQSHMWEAVTECLEFSQGLRWISLDAGMYGSMRTLAVPAPARGAGGEVYLAYLEQVLKAHNADYMQQQQQNNNGAPIAGQPVNGHPTVIYGRTASVPGPQQPPPRHLVAQ